ncbi:type I-E CRISPR-associated protein Cse2/CasB [Micromonospora sp. NPDC051296]|uniref:type I-E CRISPR-associated protein Cse2/CasB n=1 Tax=Micromonospora sp. NPDC051296 TaxID=3155046 RepID=UPI0034164511
MNTPLTVDQRREAFVRGLYALHYAADSGSPRRSADARRTLARLRRSFTGGRQEAEAYDIVFPYEPPEREQQHWLLVAGLFALHPHGKTTRGRSLGNAMRDLVEKRPSAARRFTQLLSVDVPALPHYLRQAIQLLRAEDVALDYHRLLTDMVDMQESAEQAHRVRLRWARDYHRPKWTTKAFPTVESQPAKGVAAEPVNA